MPRSSGFIHGHLIVSQFSGCTSGLYDWDIVFIPSSLNSPRIAIFLIFLPPFAIFPATTSILGATHYEVV